MPLFSIANQSPSPDPNASTHLHYIHGRVGPLSIGPVVAVQVNAETGMATSTTSTGRRHDFVLPVDAAEEMHRSVGSALVLAAAWKRMLPVISSRSNRWEGQG